MTDLDAKEAELRRINEELDRDYMSSSKPKRKPSSHIEEAKIEEQVEPPAHVEIQEEEKLESNEQIGPTEPADNEFEANLHEVQRYQEVAERNKELGKLDFIEAKIVRIQKAKIESLESELEKVISATNSKDLQITELKTNNASQSKELKEQNIKIASMSKTVEKLKKQKEDLDKRLMDSQRHNEELRKDVQKGVDERKRGDQLYNNKEIKLNRLQEELERTKILLKEAKNADSSKTDQLRKDIERMHEENRRIQRQKNQILLAFKKQFKLIDILKRQKIHIEAARLLNFTEDEFIKTLEVGDKL